MSSAYTLGRRIERLLYLGIIVLLLVVADFFLASGAAQLREDTKDKFYKEVVDSIDRKAYILKDCHRYTQLPQAKKEAELAKYKGYPTLLNYLQCDYDKELLEALKSVEKFTSPPSKRDRNEILTVFARRLSPEQTKDAIRAISGNRPSTLEIATVEVPSRVKLNVFGTDLTLPIESLALIAHLALVPLIFLWEGAIHQTRFRELNAIRTSKKSLATFPHILNIIPVVTVHNRRLSRLQKTTGFNVVGASVVRMIMVACMLLPPIIVHASTTFLLFPILEIRGVVTFFAAYFGILTGYLVLALPCFASLSAETSPVTRLETAYLE